MKKNIFKQSGFTIIEVFIVIGIIGILGAIVFVAINPVRKYAEVHDAQRRTDLLIIINAVHQFAAEHNGNLPDTNPEVNINNFPLTATCIGSSAPCFDLAAAGEIEAATGQQELVVPTYTTVMPKDPTKGTAANTQYYIYRDPNGRLIATASGELTSVISLTR